MNTVAAKGKLKRVGLMRIALTIITCFLLTGTTGAADTIVVQWNEVTLQNIRDAHPAPPIVARMLAIVDTCMYDAWTAYDPTAVPTRNNGITKRPPSEATDLNKIQAISYAAYRAEADLFPAAEVNANKLMAALGFNPTDTSSDPSTAVGIGNSTSAAVISFRHHDGANQLGDINGGTPYSDYTFYIPVNTPDQIVDPNRWQPLRVANGSGGFTVQQFTTPFWGDVIPFNPLPPFTSQGPDFYPSRQYAQEVDKILDYSADLNDRQKVIAEYWRDGPKTEQPPGHWALFAEFVSRRDRHGIDDDVKMFFAESNAIFDASIASWGIKRFYDFVRPITAVHFLKAGKLVRAWGGPFEGTKLLPGESWVPYQPVTTVTPPFAEYVSGHSMFSAAAAEILTQFTGSDQFGGAVTFAPGSSVIEPGLTPREPITLFWRTFKDAADQAGLSRRYGGIHFVDGDLDARAYGQKLGAADWEIAKTYFDGSAITAAP